jgi:hypothetical protein
MMTWLFGEAKRQEDLYSAKPGTGGARIAGDGDEEEETGMAKERAFMDFNNIKPGKKKDNKAAS